VQLAVLREAEPVERPVDAFAAAQEKPAKSQSKSDFSPFIPSLENRRKVQNPDGSRRFCNG